MKPPEFRLVKKFLRDVWDHLPYWMRKDREESQKLLEQLEDHIWAKAEEMSGGNPTINHVRQAIASMGPPATIAGEFQHQGSRRNAGRTRTERDRREGRPHVIAITVGSLVLGLILLLIFGLGAMQAGERSSSGTPWILFSLVIGIAVVGATVALSRRARQPLELRPRRGDRA